jgi:hypothetical protein
MTTLTAYPRHRCLSRLLPLAALALLPALSAPGADTVVKADWPLPQATPLSAPDFALINDSARGLAGEAPMKGSASWQTFSDWLAYQQWFDGRWNYIQRVRLTAMRGWAASELGSLRDQSQTVFYPFSGPDFLYVNTFFPDSKYLLMCGLEPIGTMPDLADLQKHDELSPYLQRIKTSLFTILAASFFKTKDMKSDFHDGLLPVIAVFLARDGYTIDSLHYVSLGHDGTLHIHDADGANGVQITYFKGDRDDLRTLIYLQADLGNDGLKDNPGFVRLMQRLAPGNTYLKAASYLLYEDYFSTIRNAILDDSVGVVEDDSGIPLRDFKPGLWNVMPYGNYTGPINLFKEDDQPDLVQFYKNRAHPALPFGSGYKFDASISSLLVAHKVRPSAP